MTSTHCGPRVHEIIQKCLVPDPLQRATIKDLVDNRQVDFRSYFRKYDPVLAPAPDSAASRGKEAKRDRYDGGNQSEAYKRRKSIEKTLTFQDMAALAQLLLRCRDSEKRMPDHFEGFWKLLMKQVNNKWHCFPMTYAYEEVDSDEEAEEAEEVMIYTNKTDLTAENILRFTENVASKKNHF